MAKKTIVVSDLSGQDIADDEQVEIRVLELDGLSQPVRLDASKTEADRLRLESQKLALVELVMPDGEVVRLAIPANQFRKAIKGDADAVLASAEGLSFPERHQPELEQPRRRGRRPRGEGAPAGEKPAKVDYTSVEHAGSVKRGIISEGEKKTVRENFDEVNNNLEASGQRTLDLSNIEHVEKYGLQELAKERGITPAAKLCHTNRTSWWWRSLFQRKTCNVPVDYSYRRVTREQAAWHNPLLVLYFSSNRPAAADHL